MTKKGIRTSFRGFFNKRLNVVEGVVFTRTSLYPDKFHLGRLGEVHRIANRLCTNPTDMYVMIFVSDKNIL